MNLETVWPMLAEKRRFRRVDWAEKAFIFLVPGSRFTVNREPLLSILGEGTVVNYEPHVDVCHGNGTIGVYVPEVSDLTADDWEEI